jgi:hypothetical protein
MVLVLALSVVDREFKSTKGHIQMIFHLWLFVIRDLYAWKNHVRIKSYQVMTLIWFCQMLRGSVVYNRFRFMGFNATFNNISVISWGSVLLVEETRVPGENHRSVASHWQTLSHNVVSSMSCYEWHSNSQR